jgi:hypothetical protein
MSLLYGLAAVAALWWLVNQFAKANPAQLAGLMKKAGGAACMALAAFFLVRGRIDMAFLIGGMGAWLLGWAYHHPFSQWTNSWRKSPGQVSTVSSVLLEMALDHDTGAMAGRVIAGAFAGRELDAMGPADLQALLADAQARDPEGVRLLEAYLDRRFAGRGEDAQPDRDAGAHRPGQPGAMTKQEAYDILGLQPGAGEEAIRQAHRALIKRLHPDAGGSSALAARVNEAKDVLLK